MTAEEPATLRVTVSGGGPVGLSFAVLLAAALGTRVKICVYDKRWLRAASRITWRCAQHGNNRRQQVVTIQSRHYLAFPDPIRSILFRAPWCSSMWPTGPDSVQGLPPVNIQIAKLEDELLALANTLSPVIELIPGSFEATEQEKSLKQQHVLALCEGASSDGDGTLRHFTQHFGRADHTMYSLHGEHLQDVVLGLQVKSDLPDPAAVLLTVAQNRYLLNSIRGEGFLNMRLTDVEAGDLADVHNGGCVSPSQLNPLLWSRVQQGLLLFGVQPHNLTSIVVFRVKMVQRPRFTAALYPRTAQSPGTYGFLLGDCANAVHFWPGRGLNSGLASAISLVNCLRRCWKGTSLRDADFMRHEAVMAMLQYRHKSRAWRFMTTNDETGAPIAIKEKIHRGIQRDRAALSDRDGDLDVMMLRLRQIRLRLSRRLEGLPNDTDLVQLLAPLSSETLQVLVASEPWDTFDTGGEEVDVNSVFGSGYSCSAPTWAACTGGSHM